MIITAKMMAIIDDEMKKCRKRLNSTVAECCYDCLGRNKLGKDADTREKPLLKLGFHSLSGHALEALELLAELLGSLGRPFFMVGLFLVSAAVNAGDLASKIEIILDVRAHLFEATTTTVSLALLGGLKGLESREASHAMFRAETLVLSTVYLSNSYRARVLELSGQC